MPKIDIAAARRREGTRYPAPFDTPCLSRVRQQLGDVVGLSQFGVNLLTLPPGAWSSQRHWQGKEDEFVWVLEGEVVLETNDGEQTLRAGHCAGFPAGRGEAHRFVNRGDRDVLLLVVGDRSPFDEVYYPTLDLHARAGADGRYLFTRKDGSGF